MKSGLFLYIPYMYTLLFRKYNHQIFDAKIMLTHCLLEQDDNDIEEDISSWIKISLILQ